jgi:WXXGXW repeat (2 copies)
MFMQKSLVGVLVAAGLGVASIMSSGNAAAHADVFIRVAPPVPYVEVVPSYRHGYVWVPGYWDWRADRYGGRHVWIAGTWVRERRGYAYVPHQWVHRDGYWVQSRGRWDRDGDGVPNRYDRHPNNPYRR